jgi:ATP adenylyltransferase
MGKEQIFTVENRIDSRTCRFCDIGRGLAHQPYDVPLIQSPDFYAVASIGALVPGWVLICPRAHATNMSESYADPQCVSLRVKLAQLLRARYEVPVRLFEHGATCTGSGTGCGVDHAHLHLVPLELLSLEDIRSFDSALSWMCCKASEIRQVSNGQEYLFYSEDGSIADPIGYGASLSQPTSQFFRKVIASKLGRGGDFNYRSHPNLSNTLATAAAFSPIEMA